jgi:molybdopterin/thiamine biosynthesis adenylyltransferase
LDSPRQPADGSSKIEASNLNRLVGATQPDVDRGLSKAEIVRHTNLGIRP